MSPNYWKQIIFSKPINPILILCFICQIWADFSSTKTDINWLQFFLVSDTICSNQISHFWLQDQMLGMRWPNFSGYTFWEIYFANFRIESHWRFQCKPNLQNCDSWYLFTKSNEKCTFLHIVFLWDSICRDNSAIYKYK